MNRLENFRALAGHAWYGRIFTKLSAAHLALCEGFIKRNDHLSAAEWELAVNRMFLDAQKPKHWKEIVELLASSNGSRK